MRFPRSLASIATIGLLVAACGGGGAATQGPGGGNPTQNPGGGGGTPTQAPVVTTDPGGGGNGGGGTGSIHLEINGGGVDAKTVDLPFFGFGSRFGGPAGLGLNFTDAEGTGIATIGGINDVITISYTDETLNANATECVLSGWNIGATSGAGSFDCKNGYAVRISDGAYLTGVNMKGNFTANQ